MATLLGAIVSDGLDDGRVVSGVGGQYNFVAQAFDLDDARSVITLPAVRDEGDGPASNICWSYGHTTIPRHLRDIVVTQYGIADLRGRSDADVIDAMPAIADSRFQLGLLEKAKAAGKIDGDYHIPPPPARTCPMESSERWGPGARPGSCRPSRSAASSRRSSSACCRRCER